MIVASFATITHSRPSMRPMPVMMPAPWMASSYIPLAASGESSRNGAPGSISVITRSRGRSLPRPTWRSRERSLPPSAASARRALQIVDQRTHRLRIGAEIVGGRVGDGLDDGRRDFPALACRHYGVAGEGRERLATRRQKPDLVGEGTPSPRFRPMAVVCSTPPCAHSSRSSHALPSRPARRPNGWAGRWSRRENIGRRIARRSLPCRRPRPPRCTSSISSTSARGARAEVR